MFFFSSRRRHTRSLCDWSSDVCPSDLYQGQEIAFDRRAGSYGIAQPYPPGRGGLGSQALRSEEHTSELQSHSDLVCRLLLEKKKKKKKKSNQKNKNNKRTSRHSAHNTT